MALKDPLVSRGNVDYLAGAQVPGSEHPLAGGAHPQLHHLAQEWQSRVDEGVSGATGELTRRWLGQDCSR